jgi:hypothetical protein
MATRTVTEKMLCFGPMQRAIDNAAMNMVGIGSKARRRRGIATLLTEYSKSVAAMAMKQPVFPPELQGDWKRRWANECADLILAAGLNELIEKTIVDIRKRFPRAVQLEDGLLKYGLYKLGSYAAQVSRLLLCGIDPELLRMTSDEQDKYFERLHGARHVAVYSPN